MLRRTIPLALALLCLAGCTASEDRACHVHADCASGTCLPDGTCAAPDAGTSSEEPDAGEPKNEPDAGTPDAGPIDEVDAGTPPSNSCVPNRDGTIARSEVPVSAGLHATFRVAADVAVSSAGQQEGAARVWDFSTSLQGDQTVRVDLQPLEGTWFEKSFPGATYAARLNQSSELLGVFEASPETLLLRGVVSPEDGLYATKLTYDPPVPVLQFPLTAGKAWKQTSTVSGLASGFVAYYSETYDSKVDAQGDVRTPFATFPSLRVRTDLTRTVGFLVTTVRSFLFVTECFGTIAGITSKDNERAPEFNRAAELRRLAP